MTKRERDPVWNSSTRNVLAAPGWLPPSGGSPGTQRLPSLPSAPVSPSPSLSPCLSLHSSPLSLSLPSLIFPDKLRRHTARTPVPGHMAEAWSSLQAREEGETERQTCKQAWREGSRRGTEGRNGEFRSPVCPRRRVAEDQRRRKWPKVTSKVLQSVPGSWRLRGKCESAPLPPPRMSPL